jgi:Papain family cysteine protease
MTGRVDIHAKVLRMVRNGKRDDDFLPLQDCRLPKLALERLAALGINAAEEVRDYWAYGNRQLLSDYLGESPVQLAASASRARGARGIPRDQDFLNALMIRKPPALVMKPRGLALTAAQKSRPAEAPEPVRLSRSRQPAKPKVCLIDRFPAARDQRERGTCVAFATVAYLEYHLYKRPRRRKHHSEQFLFWACKQCDRRPKKDDTYLKHAQQALKTWGVCLHETWPYNGSLQARVDQGPPPPGSEEQARKYIWPETRGLDTLVIAELRESLDEGNPVVLGVITHPNWDFPTVFDTGKVTMPLPGMRPDGGHAVCLVGYEENKRFPGGGAFIFRNSWGERWARAHPRYGEGGYGTLFFEYVLRYGTEAFS